MLANIPQRMTAHRTRRPDPSVREQRVEFGTSGHRSSALDSAFVDPLGGAGVHYLGMIGDRCNLPLTVVSEAVDATFRSMTADRDGKIRLDPSSLHAMQRLTALKCRFDVAWMRAPGNDAPIAGLNAITARRCFAARQSGPEDLYRLSAVSFEGSDHLARIQEEAHASIQNVFVAARLSGELCRP